MNILHEPGAPSGNGTIPLSVPVLQGNEWNYIKECLDTGWVSSVGSYVDRFERDLAAFVGTKHAVACVNGTAAIHVALLVAGIGQDDEVLVSTLTFIAPVNAIRYTGAWPVFIDSELDTWQMDPQAVAEFLDQDCEVRNGQLTNKQTGRAVKAIMPVHILGHPVDMAPIMDLAKKYDLVVIEDASEALGAQYKGQNVGAIGDIATFSFNGNKIITTGGGGMLVTDNPDFARKAKYFSTQAKDDSLEYIHHEIGYNYRLPNVLAAMGCAQLEQLGKYIEKKLEIATRYQGAFSRTEGITPLPEAKWADSVFWLYTILIDPEVCGGDSRDLLRYLRAHRIQSRPLWQPAHLSPAHQYSLQRACPTAERLNAQAISLPCSVDLTEADQTRVIDAVLAWRDGAN